MNNFITAFSYNLAKRDKRIVKDAVDAFRETMHVFRGSDRWPDTVMETVNTIYSTDIETLVERNQRYEVVRPRQVAMVMLFIFTKLTVTQIGSRFKRDHATVLHSITAVSNALTTKSDAEKILICFRKLMAFYLLRDEAQVEPLLPPGCHEQDAVLAAIEYRKLYRR